MDIKKKKKMTCMTYIIMVYILDSNLNEISRNNFSAQMQQVSKITLGTKTHTNSVDINLFNFLHISHGFNFRQSDGEREIKRDEKVKNKINK